MLLHSFGSLALSSTLQMKVSLSKIKQDAENSEEAAVYNALQYLESINNKAYGHALSEFSTSDEQRDEAFNWANQNPYLQKKMRLLNTVYQSENAIQKKAAHVFSQLVYIIRHSLDPYIYSDSINYHEQRN